MNELDREYHSIVGSSPRATHDGQLPPCERCGRINHRWRYDDKCPLCSSYHGLDEGGRSSWSRERRKQLFLLSLSDMGLHFVEVAEGRYKDLGDPPLHFTTNEKWRCGNKKGRGMRSLASEVGDRFIGPNTRLWFGKHKGWRLKDVPKDYLQHLVDKCEDSKAAPLVYYLKAKGSVDASGSDLVTPQTALWFGKHRGMPISSVPDGYLEYILTWDDDSEGNRRLKDVVTEVLASRQGWEF